MVKVNTGLLEFPDHFWYTRDDQVFSTCSPEISLRDVIIEYMQSGFKDSQMPFKVIWGWWS